jgi:hypothetical protein
VAGVGLDDEAGSGEQGGVFGGDRRRPLQVEAAADDQHGRAEAGQPGPGGSRVERSVGAEGLGRVVIYLVFFGGVVGLGGCVPAAVEERGRGRPVGLGSPACGDPLERRGRVGEPRLPLTEVDDLASRYRVPSRPPGRSA